MPTNNFSTSQRVKNEERLAGQSATVRRAETTALRNPVMPIGDSFRGMFVNIQANQLGKGHGHAAALPVDLDKHVCITGLFRSHAESLERFSFPER